MLDTNILLQSADSIFGFDDNDVWITGTTLQELDRKKTAKGEAGYEARRAARILDSLREEGDLTKGIALPGGGRLSVLLCGMKRGLLPDGFSMDSPDNQIIAASLALAAGSPDRRTALVTNDVMMRVNAQACGLEAQGYRNEEVREDYAGRAELPAGSDLIDALYRDGSAAPGPEHAGLLENQYAVLRSPEGKSALAVYRDGVLRPVRERKVFGIRPRNAAQTFALHALTAPADELPLVILSGPAGTAKTFLSIAAGLDGVYDDPRSRRYGKVLISRNNVTSDDGFGYLPGDLEEKMEPLLAPFYDNMETILTERDGAEDAGQVQMMIDDMLQTSVQVAPMAYMRGRSITNSYLILDEAQNATRSQIRDVITRAGRNCKIVIAGDVNQIDAAGLDRRNNGLVYAIDRMKGTRETAVVAFTDADCRRSRLAQVAIRQLR